MRVDKNAVWVDEHAVLIVYNNIYYSPFSHPLCLVSPSVQFLKIVIHPHQIPAFLSLLQHVPILSIVTSPHMLL